MSEHYFLAIDGGSSSVRAILFDQNGHQIYTKQQKWEHLADPRYPGSMSFDCQKNWSIIAQIIKDLITESQIDPEKIATVSTTTMREGFVLYDERGNELIGFANVDSRAESESAYLKVNQPDLEKDLFHKTGESFALGALPRLLWVANKEKEIAQSSKYLNMLNDWITYKLSDQLVSEPSNSSTTGLFDLRKRQWDFSPLESIDMDLSPVKVIESGGYVSQVSPNASKQTGLSVHTKVMMGGGDAQLGCIGIGAIEENQTALLGGTFWQLNHNVKEFNGIIDSKVRLNCHAVPDLFQYELIAWQIGNTIDWFIQSFLDKEIEEFTNKTDLHHYINQQVSIVPAGSNGVISTFANEMNMMDLKNCSPTFTNFGLDANLYHKFVFYRSLLENTAYVVKKHKIRIEAASGQLINEILFAGGAANSSLWCQILADVLQVTLKVPEVKEATALGAAMVAAIGSGILTKDQVKGWVKIENEYHPQQDDLEMYNEQFAKWEAVYAKQLELVNEGITTSMWKAPGL